MSVVHEWRDLITLFAECFRDAENTVLQRGGDEPLYLPATATAPARLIFAHGYFASALHETAHWCIAGRRRRQLVDFGYWYQPDGRTPAQQQAFEAAEARPQAIEWLFHVAAGHPFRVSFDNLAGHGAADEARFRAAILAEIAELWLMGFPPRAWRFAQALATRYAGQDRLRADSFLLLPP